MTALNVKTKNVWFEQDPAHPEAHPQDAPTFGGFDDFSQTFHQNYQKSTLEGFWTLFWGNRKKTGCKTGSLRLTGLCNLC